MAAVMAAVLAAAALCHCGAQTGATAELSCPLEAELGISRLRWAGLLGFSYHVLLPLPYISAPLPWAAMTS